MSHARRTARTSGGERRRIGAAASAAAALLAAAGCSGPSAGAGTPLDDSTVEALIAAAVAAAGPIVDDADIRLDTDTSTLSIGGLPITLPLFANYRRAHRSITVPRGWPVHEPMGFWHSNEASTATFGVGVFIQSPLVTDPDDNSRQALFDMAFFNGGLHEAALVHESAIGDPDTEIACWTQVRYGKQEGLIRSPAVHRAVILLGGPGVAASGTIISAATFTGVPELTADFVEAACGVRPDIPSLADTLAATTEPVGSTDAVDSTTSTP